MWQDHESNPSSEPEIENTLNSPCDLDLSIAIRKVQESAQNDLPISNYVSLDRFLANHKRFTVSLNFVVIPNIVTEALTEKEWRCHESGDGCIEKEQYLENY